MKVKVKAIYADFEKTRKTTQAKQADEQDLAELQRTRY